MGKAGCQEAVQRMRVASHIQGTVREPLCRIVHNGGGERKSFCSFSPLSHSSSLAFLLFNTPSICRIHCPLKITCLLRSRTLQTPLTLACWCQLFLAWGEGCENMGQRRKGRHGIGIGIEPKYPSPLKHFPSFICPFLLCLFWTITFTSPNAQHGYKLNYFLCLPKSMMFCMSYWKWRYHLKSHSHI